MNRVKFQSKDIRNGIKSVWNPQSVVRVNDTRRTAVRVPTIERYKKNLMGAKKKVRYGITSASKVYKIA